mmetsp:Transcript_34245/g.38850  ORF Transcript_34245/g.38850 Transcript_34245/m.38850 type:complete len:564 (+) Transcript_34245:36-1727(+)|eukprot:CAMPEP_0115011210 /NCGR_PEP_ID=MMETSP0216-20121206/23834_1 /TAXON_ID=223996 /ORGANISM="Protocruzia adherens, Strain Boccale" /LENGTH=563 /DNA_ID=CAMNT_0002379689 /DNA_START=26 /DNA_END=1717 /DNA_ORIENTATION=-
MKATFALCLSLAVTLGSAIPQWVPAKDDTINGNATLQFKVALKQQNLEHLDQLFWHISDPDGPLFGKFLEHEQIADLISLSEEKLALVEQHLVKDSGKFCDVEIRRSLHRDYIHVSTCVDQAKLILPNLQLIRYQREDNSQTILRSPTLVDLSQNLTFLGMPHELHQYLGGIHDLTDLPPVNSKTDSPNSKESWLPSDKELTILDVIDALGVTMEGVSGVTLVADNPQVRQAVVEMENALIYGPALSSFQSTYGLKQSPIRVIGLEKYSSLSADIDGQTITAIAQGVHTWSFVFSATASWVDVVEKIMQTEGAPRVISVSWNSIASLLQPSAMKAANISLMKLGLAGYTWLSSTGNEGPLINPSTCNAFDSRFPATSQYVVSVGGNKVTTGQTNPTAWFRSGGGFSEYFPRPSFQEEAVQKYLNSTTLPLNPKGERYGTTGRAFPDISGFGAYYPIIHNGEWVPIAGTAASTMQVAGIVTLIQIHRYQKGLGPLGPLIQPLYKLKNGVGFDVTEGQTYALSTDGCAGDIYPGFKAAEGWDPTSGLGSPEFKVLLEQLMTLGDN